MPDPGRAGKGAAKDRSGRGAGKGDKRAARQRSALESQLAKADKVVAKRTAQLAAATAARAKVAARLAAAPAPSPSPAKPRAAKAATTKPAAKAAPASAKAKPTATRGSAGASGPMAYCLRDKARVAMVAPKAVVLAGGRMGVSGTCPKCGAKLVRLGAL
jgi:hypothetical protein